MMVVTLAAIAKKPSTSDEVKNVAIDSSQTPNRSKCFIINRDKLCIVHVVVSRNLQSHKHPALKPLSDAPLNVCPS